MATRAFGLACAPGLAAGRGRRHRGKSGAIRSLRFVRPPQAAARTRFPVARPRPRGSRAGPAPNPFREVTIGRQSPYRRPRESGVRAERDRGKTGAYRVRPWPRWVYVHPARSRGPGDRRLARWGLLSQARPGHGGPEDRWIRKGARVPAGERRLASWGRRNATIAFTMRGTGADHSYAGS